MEGGYELPPFNDRQHINCHEEHGRPNPELQPTVLRSVALLLSLRAAAELGAVTVGGAVACPAATLHSYPVVRRPGDRIAVGRLGPKEAGRGKAASNP